MTDHRCHLLRLDVPHAEQVRRQLPDPEQLTAAATAAKALSDPTRLRIAVALNVGGELCVCDLAWFCGLPQNLTSHHLQRLRQAALARSRRSGKLVMYSLTVEGARVVAGAQAPLAAKL